jgi:hypothetical protein
MAAAGNTGMAGKPRIFVTPGQRFGRLIVTSPETRRGRHRAAECRCDCGEAVTVRLSHLVSGTTVSCGCLRRELSSQRGRTPEVLEHLAQLQQSLERRAIPAVTGAATLTTHGLSGHPLYQTWCGMIARCEQPGSISYPRYGGRGIRVCAEWHDVTTFIGWVAANLGPRPAGHSIDRIDNDGNYEPGNVRWATRSEQSRNQRRGNVAQQAMVTA